MITGFSLFPGEVFLGAITRYRQAHAIHASSALMEHLFGVENFHVSVTFPSMLATFAAMLPPGHSITAETLLMQHTAYPYATAFNTTTRATSLREAMMYGGGRGMQSLSGLKGGRRAVDQKLRFCPLCAAADQRTYGESYWHLLHQLSSVLVCPDHEVWLEDSHLSLSLCVAQRRLTPVNAAMVAVSPRPLDGSYPKDALALTLARDVAWLLAHPVLAKLEAVRTCYRTVLAERGVATYRGRVKCDRIHDLILAAYPPALLSQFGILVYKGTRLNWLYRLFGDSGEVLHPIYHLVLLSVLDLSVQTFFTQESSPAFFGDGPWPCLNPVCSDFKQSVIQTCRIEFRIDSGGHPTGVFACHCGYSYSRTGPDQMLGDRWRKTAIEAYGAVWEETLRRAWVDPTRSVKSIAEQFHTRPEIIKRNAARLGLSFDRTYQRLLPFLKKIPEGPRGGSRRDEARLAHAQRAWLLAIETQPDMTIGNLAQQLPNEYAVLLRQCPAWLAEQTPRSLRHMLKARSQAMWTHIWRARDRRWARQVREVAKTMRVEWETPVRITTASVMSRLGKLGAFSHYRDKLPRTTRALERVVESSQAFTIRRLRLAAAHRLQGQPNFTRSQLLEAAQVRRSIDDPIIAKVIDELCAQNRRLTG